MPLEAETREQLSPEVRRYIEELESRTEQLQEELRLALYKRFSRSSEQEAAQSQQLFEEAESEAAESQTSSTAASEQEDAETVDVPAYRRRKRGRKPIGENVPRVEVHHDIDEAEKRCGCGAEMSHIDDEISERLETIPEQIYAVRHIRPKYACRHCEGAGDEERPAVRIAEAPASIIPGSIVTPSLLAFIVVNKFVDHLPLYRQTARFARIGVEISRQAMSNWVVTVGRMVGPLVECFRDLIRDGPRIQMDETRLQVLREAEKANTSESYMWLTRGGPPEAPVFHYEYARSRGADAPRRMLAGYEGYVQADGYDIYEKLLGEEPGITLVGCWAHARRKFYEAVQASSKAGAAHEGLKRINELYRIERELRAENLSDEEFVAERRRRAEPKLERFKQWLTKKNDDVPPSTLVGKAVHYTLSEWDHLVRYLDLAALTPDNNAALSSGYHNPQDSGNCFREEVSGPVAA
jgi:transposase